jgi:signal transduction histidine kinase/ActR/RegA family two-component response regulator
MRLSAAGALTLAGKHLRRHRIGAATLLCMLVISGAFGVTAWRNAHAKSSGIAALAESADLQRGEEAGKIFWHEREAMNEYLVGHQPEVLGEVAKLNAEFVRVTADFDAVGYEGVLGERARAGNRSLFVEFTKIRKQSGATGGSGLRVTAALQRREDAVTGPLLLLESLNRRLQMTQMTAAEDASSQARYVAWFGAALALLAGLGFAFYISRLLARAIRQAEILQRTLGEREEAHAALREREDELRQAQKMEAVGRLAGGVAHDFNNMLLAITGYGELALADVGPDQSRRDHALEQIGVAASRAAGLTAQLLTFSRRQVLQTRVLAINDLIDGLTSMLRPLLGATIELCADLTEDAAAIKADPGQLEQIVTNLAVNARDAMPDGGRITIATAVVEQAATPALAGLPHGSYVMLSVSDTGEGMSKETQARAFDPFFTTKEPGKGTGLGLATAHGIISQTGGCIDIRSALHEGTTVSLYLPLTDSTAETPIIDERVAPRGSETVLLVEDDEQVRLMLCDALEAQGYGVIAVDEAAAAIDAFEGRDRPIDLLLTDIVMPGMQGRELSEHLCTTSPQLRTVFMSGYTQDALLYEDAEAGRIDFLQKPFAAVDLASTVRRVLDRAVG